MRARGFNSVLFVCTGNICRSPTAEGVMLQKVAQAGLESAIVVDSAGTHDYHVGKAPDPRTVRHAAQRGYDLTGLRARQFQLSDFTRFDLILAMDHENLSQLTRIVTPQDAGKLMLFMDQAEGPPGREVPDPYYGGPSGFERVLDLVEPTIEELIRNSRGVPATRLRE